MSCMTLHFALYLVTASLINAAGSLIELSWFCECPMYIMRQGKGELHPYPEQSLRQAGLQIMPQGRLRSFSLQVHVVKKE